MLVLLPPSEGKAASGSGAALDLESLSLPVLNEARREVLRALVDLCSGAGAGSGDGDLPGGPASSAGSAGSAGDGKALEVLGLSEGQRGEITKNAVLETAPALPAWKLYTGVLYDALGLATMDTAARRRAARSLLVFSGLWGAVRIGDRVPPYRCPMGVRLPGTGALGSFWRAPMAEAMPQAAGRGLVLDLRSSAYTGAWRPKGEVAERTATVRVLQVRTVNGVERRTVVSHFNKATKGRLTRDLLLSGAAPKNPAALADALRELGYRVEARAPGRAGRTWELDVLVTGV